jgi:hypothetical protein
MTAAVIPITQTCDTSHLFEQSFELLYVGPFWGVGCLSC